MHLCSYLAHVECATHGAIAQNNSTSVISQCISDNNVKILNLRPDSNRKILRQFAPIGHMRSRLRRRIGILKRKDTVNGVLLYRNPHHNPLPDQNIILRPMICLTSLIHQTQEKRHLRRQRSYQWNVLYSHQMTSRRPMPSVPPILVVPSSGVVKDRLYLLTSSRNGIKSHCPFCKFDRTSRQRGPPYASDGGVSPISMCIARLCMVFRAF